MTRTAVYSPVPTPDAGGGGSDEVVVRMRMAATAETVFRFFTDPARFSRWIGSGAMGMPGEGTTIEPRVGGALRVTYPWGQVASGTVVEMVPARKMVFTWGYENDPAGMTPGSTRVEITLSPEPGGTLVTLRNSGIPTAEQRQGHVFGWRFYLSILASGSSADQVAGSGAIEAYTRAWNEADGVKRRGILETCWEAAGSFRDTHGSTEGIDELSAHIENSRRHMPWFNLQTGKSISSHGHLCFAWRVAGKDGTVAMSGTNVARLGMSGKIELMVGFLGAPGAE
jgi:uncharacterized protein YndB with AHSA1/START domain